MAKSANSAQTSFRAEPLSVVIPTRRRTAQLLDTLARIAACNPVPAEIIVHVDGGDTETAFAVKETFSDVVVLQSEQRLGPGGGRNRLAKAAKHPFIVSFDDDSYPLDQDFFQRAAQVTRIYPEAAVIGCTVVHRGEAIRRAEASAGVATIFMSGGTLFRRDAFLAAGGFLPLPIAYGMEEVDLALRLAERGAQILYSPWLRVHHDSDLSHQANAEITSAAITNTALHAFLRYPLRALPYGAAQVTNRVVWSLRAGRFAGIGNGLAGIPSTLWRHRRLRKPVSPETLARVRRLRRAEKHDLLPLSLPDGEAAP